MRRGGGGELVGSTEGLEGWGWGDEDGGRLRHRRLFM